MEDNSEMLEKLSEEEEKKDPEAMFHRNRALHTAWHAKRKEMSQTQLQMLLRVTLQLADGELGQLRYKNQSRDEYTGNHLFLFECELQTPP